MQALLEADPSSREPQDSYLARYQTVARDELEAALSHYEALQASLGASRLQHLEWTSVHSFLLDAGSGVIKDPRAACGTQSWLRSCLSLQHALPWQPSGQRPKVLMAAQPPSGVSPFASPDTRHVDMPCLQIFALRTQSNVTCVAEQRHM